MSPQGYRRSWRNLVLDRDVQLEFTLFMVVSCALFMAALGYLVLKEADTATTTAIQDVQGQPLLDAAVAQATIAGLEARKDLLVGVLVGTFVLLVAGLFFFGIKMTHHVAGPLYKVGMYCDKVAAGRFDKLYPLRRGDQLVSFYEHFKHAHEVLRQHEERDRACLRAVIAAAEEADLGARSPELAARLDDVRSILTRKEASHG